VSFSFIDIWVVFYALLFLPRLGLTVQMAVAAAAYLTAVAFFERSGAYSFTALEPVLLATVVGTTSAVVTMLSRPRESSEIDPLTCVANRRGLDRFLESAVRGATAEHRSLIVATIDVDCFKTINDVQGHAYGDQLHLLGRGGTVATR
jgi:GGDEF domain-containing protein